MLGIVFASMSAIRQIDIKKIIAYSSIAHMNLSVIGVFSLTYQGIQGSLYLLLSHGLVSSALFFLVGILYDRYYTKLLKYYGGLVIKMPIFSTIFFFYNS
jgi:NADH:ubiquinone oxidoreductase subunit 4 (subunit M)